MINGKIFGYFAYSRGVHQGDPLFPLLFCLAEDFLSRMLSSKVISGALAPMLYTRHTSFQTHFLYADDVLLFAKASIRNIRVINSIFATYAQVSG